MILSFCAFQALRFALAPKRARALLRHHASLPLHELFAVSENEALHALPLEARQAWRELPPLSRAEQLVDRCEQAGVEILLPTDERWPAALERLGAHAPDILFLRGVLPSQEGIAFIGTRKPSPYGLRATDHLIHELRNARLPILSGLALGIDGAAHAAALRAHLPTLAILGTSITDREIGPRSHLPLAHQILDAGGGILSELPPGTITHKGAFPERNRLIAALSRAVVVVEANERSGTMITSRVALELGRDVLAVPGSIFSPTSTGTHRLLTAGARPCTNARDLWEALALEPAIAQARTKISLHTNPQDTPILEACAAASEGLPLDDLVATTGSSPEELTERLALLELQGLVQQDLAGRWRIAGLAS